MAKQGSTSKVITRKHIARLERERRQTRIIIGVVIGAVLLVAGLLAYGGIRYNIIAEVNGEKIMAGTWQERVKLQRVQLINVYNQYVFFQQSYGIDYSQQAQQIVTTLQTSDILGQQVLDQMVDEILIRQEAKKRGITASPEEVDAAVRENFNFFPDGTPTPTVTPTDISFPTLTTEQLTLYPPTATPTEFLTETPAPTATVDPSFTATPASSPVPATPTPVPDLPTPSPTPYTLSGFQSEYAKMLENFDEYGISEETIKSIYEVQILRRKLAEDLGKDVPRTEEQVWARHILLETETEAKAEYTLLTTGADFATLARRDSKDTGSAANGGDMGWHDRSYFVKEFADAAFSQKVGEIGKPVKSEFGYHIIQVLDRQELPLTDAQIQQKQETALSDWLTLTREAADIKTYDVWRERVPMEPNLQTQ